MSEASTSASGQAAQIIALTLIVVVVSGAGLLAYRNVRLRRADTRGALRLGAFVLIVSTVARLFSMYHQPRMEELLQVGAAFSKALFEGAMATVIYMAIEPFVRRSWPQTIVSWSRVLAGKLRDPIAGGDILIGVAFGLFWSILFQTYFLATQNAGELANYGDVAALSSPAFLVSGFLSQLTSAVTSAFQSFFLFFLSRLVARRNWLAAVIFVAVPTAMNGLKQPHWYFFAMLIVVYGVLALLLLRYGIVPLMVGMLTANCLLNAPLTVNFSSWYIASSLFSLAVFFAIALYGFRRAVAGKPLFDVE